MKKIGGINMSEMTKLKGHVTFSAIKSFENSIKEVKLNQEGKIHLDTWEEYLNKKRKHKE
ncbi:MAG: hypothetical protein HFJ17_04425 [Clostridia bacterium]|nr:hypothetical protein [Clostridia bacterium]